MPLREAAEPGASGAWLSGQWLLQCPKLQREGPERLGAVDGMLAIAGLVIFKDVMRIPNIWSFLNIVDICWSIFNLVDLYLGTILLNPKWTI